MWCLSEEMVPLALCDDETSDEEKADNAIGMLNARIPQQFAPGNPVMKTHLLDNQPVEEIRLHDFVLEQSWLLLEHLDVAVDWMHLPPPIWLQSAPFLRFQEMVHSLKVVNDCAERAVKDITEFIHYSWDAGRRDCIQVVVNHHSQLLDFQHLTKQQIDKMEDFL